MRLHYFELWKASRIYILVSGTLFVAFFFYPFKMYEFSDWWRFHCKIMQILEFKMDAFKKKISRHKKINIHQSSNRFFLRFCLLSISRMKSKHLLELWNIKQSVEEAWFLTFKIHLVYSYRRRSNWMVFCSHFVVSLTKLQQWSLLWIQTLN